MLAIYCTRLFPFDTALSTFRLTLRGETAVAGQRPARDLYLTDAYAATYPAAANVRSGTTYGAGNSLTGTCAVPGAASVVVGVPVDNTTGTAAVTAASIRSALGLAAANLDSQLAAIPTTAAPTAVQVRQEMDANSTKLANLDATVSSRSTYAGGDTSGTTTLLSRLTSTRAGNLDSLDATVSSRLASASYTSPPSAASVASAVWAALTSGLNTANSIGALLVANINASISSRSTYDGSDTSGTTTLLSRLTSTRATGLDNLDTAVSSRLASSGYTAPPSASSIATAVWANTTRTLTTAIDNSATIAAAVWAYASGRTITGGTVDTLTNAPTVPSVAQITAGVWGQAASGLTAAGTIGAQLATNLDQPVSTRLAASSYTTPPTTGAIRTELSVELARIDQPISSRSTYSGADTAGTTTLLGRLTSGRASNLDLIDVASSTRLAASSYTTPPTVAAIVAAIDKTGYSLTDAERQAISTVVQQGILNENDGQQVLNAIVAAIGNQNIDQVALVAAIRADLERSGGTLATRLAASAYTAPPSASDNATATRQAIAAELARIDQPISTRLAATAYTTPPTVADVAAGVWSYGSRVLSSVTAIVSGVWGAASRTVTGGSVDSLVNAPDVPTGAEIASSVRQELSPELARVSNAATTQEVAEIVEGALQQP